MRKHSQTKIYLKRKTKKQKLYHNHIRNYFFLDVTYLKLRRSLFDRKPFIKCIKKKKTNIIKMNTNCKIPQ